MPTYVTAGRSRPNPGRIAEYDPMEQMGGGGTPYSNRNSAGARQVYDSNVGRGKHFSETCKLFTGIDVLMMQVVKLILGSWSSL